MILVLKQSELPSDALAHEFIGAQHGDVGACVIFVDAAPGQGPSLHRHPYVELLIVIEGTATFDDGDSKREVSAGGMVAGAWGLQSQQARRLRRDQEGVGNASRDLPIQSDLSYRRPAN
jgi:uncharacterized cupin superfamily protein